MLDYAVVVATRNRLDALRVSVPLFLRQSHPPARLIVVDHSDDHAAVATYLGEVARETSILIETIYSNAANSAQQRNLGIARVVEPVTMLPDDDSLWFPDTAERLIAVYERDSKGIIGGVAGLDWQISPLVKNQRPASARGITSQKPIIHLRNRLEDVFVPQPFRTFGRHFITRLKPAIIQAQLDDLAFVEAITGFRMSYRTEILHEHKFDAVLGSRVGYAIGEDMDLSLRVQKSGLGLAAAPGARVFHNIYPGKRANGFPYGFIWIMNSAYIYRKVFGDAPSGPGPVRRYLRYKTFLYHLRRRSTYHRDIARGASAAIAEFDRMWRAPDDRLADVYSEICDRILRTN